VSAKALGYPLGAESVKADPPSGVIDKIDNSYQIDLDGRRAFL
jgi:hypothetical protein